MDHERDLSLHYVINTFFGALAILDSSSRNLEKTSRKRFERLQVAHRLRRISSIDPHDRFRWTARTGAHLTVRVHLPHREI